MIRRTTTYLNHWIISSDRKPLVLRGARQVGKSSLVRIFAKQHKLKLVEINLEKHRSLDRVFASLKLPDILAAIADVSHTHIDPENSLLFLDEIQATPHALASLRYFYEERPDLPVIAAGSLLDFLLAEHEFSMPVGRVEYLHIEPMSFQEFLLAKEQHWLSDRISSFKIGESWSQEIHDDLKRLLREYFFVGGMPQAVQAHAKEKGHAAIRRIQNSILNTYRDDFNKYTKRRLLTRIAEVFDALPGFVGKKIKYSRLLPDSKAQDAKNCIELLSFARVLRQVFHTSAEGIPLASHVKREVYKIFWLDIGLLNRRLGLDLSDLQNSLVHEGQLAEQFIAQQLSLANESDERPFLYYWLRESKVQNAEVDFLLQVGPAVVPIEVKSGATGHLRSLHQFVARYHSRLAVKFCDELPSLQKCRHEVNVDGEMKTVEYQLLVLPMYFCEFLPAIIRAMEKDGDQ